MNREENCTHIQNSQFDSVDLFSVRLVFCVLYCSVWIAAIVGNSLVLYVVSFNQVSLSVRSVFIGCLAVSDLLMGLTSLPVTAVTTFTRVWIFPSIFCKLIGIFQGGSIFVSSFTLTVIAVDRCLLILKPNQEIINYRRAMMIVVGIWSLGYSLALPTGLFSSETVYTGYCGAFCEEVWPDWNEETGRSDQRRLYGLSVLILQFGIPTVISSFCYIKISRVMDNQLERRRGHTLLKECEEKLVNRKTRANRMMIAMVVGFFFAWMPLNGINLYRDLSTFNVTPWFSTVFALCHVIAMMSGVLNPVIYSWFNPQFRSAIQSLFRSEKKRKHTTSTNDKFQTEILPSNTRLEPKKGLMITTESSQTEDQLL